VSAPNQISTASARTAAAGVDLTGRSALVTGAARGVGLACARRLAEAGAAVTVLDINGDAAQSVADSIGGLSRQADLTHRATIDGLDVTADILVNNAGFQHIAPLEDFPPERFAAMLRLTIEAPFRLIQTLLPGMYERGYGRISTPPLCRLARVAVQVRVRDGQARTGGPVQGVGRRREGRHVQLHQPSICAHATDGEANRRAGTDPRHIRGRRHRHGAARRQRHQAVVESAEVAELAVYLCSSEASFINGTSLCIDGGWTAD